MKVTVVTPTFNRAQYIVATLQSIFNQDYQNIEVIVVDDGSTDGTAEIVNSLKDPRLRFLKTKANTGGPAIPMSMGAENATGELVAFLDHDDIALPHWLSTLADTMKADVSTGMAWGQHAVCDKDGVQRTVAFRNPFKGKNEKLPTMLGWTPGTSGLMVRKSVFDEIGFFDEKAGYIADLDFTVRFALQSKLAARSIAKTVINYIVHSQNLSRRSVAVLAENLEYFIEKNRGNFVNYPIEKGIYHYKAAWMYNQIPNKAKALSHISHAILCDNKNFKYKLWKILLVCGLLNLVKPYSAIKTFTGDRWRAIRHFLKAS